MTVFRYPPTLIAPGSFAATSTKQDEQITEAVLTNSLLGAQIDTPFPAMPVGGIGVIGWLSAIWTKLNSFIFLKSIPQVPVYAQSLVIDESAVTTFLAPAGATGAKIMSSSDNEVKLKITVDGSMPSATDGFVFEAGRSEDFVATGDIKVIAQTAPSSGQAVYIHWSVNA